jgi:predicted nucleic acid-binding protein
VAGGAVRTVVLDASVVINLIHAGRLDLLGKIEGYEFVVPEQVIALEVTYPEQAQALATALEAGWVRRVESINTVEIELYAELSAVMGKGEAACLAIAAHRGWMVACDETGRFRHEADARIGRHRIMNTPGVIVLAIRCRQLSVKEADDIKDVLARNRYVMPFESFRDVMQPDNKN